MLSSKRGFDVLVALIGLGCLALLLPFIALGIKLDSPGPVFFRGVRAGRDGVFFSILKFRTMVTDAALRGAGITQHNDARVTRVGKFLRRFKLDELPQLWNVLRGEMSLVGPRPEDPRYLQYYTPAQRALLSISPGVTGVASLAFRDEAQLLTGEDWERVYIEQVLPAKLDLELAYLQRRTFWTDVQVLMQTVLVLFGRRNWNVGRKLA